MAKRQTRTELWLQGDGGPRTVPAGTTNEWGGNLRSEGRPVLLRRNPLGLVEGYSTTSSTIVPLQGGGYAVVPTVVDGKDIGEAGAYRHFRETGEYWGKASTISGAEDIADSVHERHAELNFDEWNAFASSSLPALAPDLREEISQALRDDARATVRGEGSAAPETQMALGGGSTKPRTGGKPTVRAGAIGGHANRRRYGMPSDMKARSAKFATGWNQDASGNWVPPGQQAGVWRSTMPRRRDSFSDEQYKKAMDEYRARVAAANRRLSTMHDPATGRVVENDGGAAERRKLLDTDTRRAEQAAYSMAYATEDASGRPTAEEAFLRNAETRAGRRQSFRDELDERVARSLADKAEARKPELARLAASNAARGTETRAWLATKGNAQFPTGRTPKKDPNVTPIDAATFTTKLELAKLLAERYRGTDKYASYMERIQRLEARGPVDKEVQAKIRKDQEFANREAMGDYGKTLWDVNTGGGRLVGGNDPYGERDGLGRRSNPFDAIAEAHDRKTRINLLPVSNIGTTQHDGGLLLPLNGYRPSAASTISELADRSRKTGVQGDWGTLLRRYQWDAAARAAHQKVAGQTPGGEVSYGYGSTVMERVKKLTDVNQDQDQDQDQDRQTAAKGGNSRRAKRAAILGGTSSGPRTSGVGLRSFGGLHFATVPGTGGQMSVSSAHSAADAKWLADHTSANSDLVSSFRSMAGRAADLQSRPDQDAAAAALASLGVSRRLDAARNRSYRGDTWVWTRANGMTGALGWPRNW